MVNYGEDAKFKKARFGALNATIKVKFVTYGEDVKLKEVTYGEDFKLLAK